MNDSVPNNLTFEQALAELEQIVHDLEDGQIGLEDALSRYEKGVGLLKGCYAQLQQAERRIQLLTGMTADGEPMLQSFETPAPGDDNEAKKRQRKASDSNILF